MNQSVDERILSMRFDNRKFNKEIESTIKNLDEFDEKLEFKDAGKGLDKLKSSFSNFSDEASDVMTNFCGGVANGFASLYDTIKRVFIVRLGSDLYNMAKRGVKELTTDQISAGFSKYEEQTKSSFTIMSSTGKSVEEVDRALERLMWFSDETSYSFTDMVNNVGKFTSQNIDLDTSIKAMQGISTAAALAGQGTDVASRAMYNFAQSLATGSVKLMDWKSIENANMATAEFKQTIIDTAKAMGTLNEQSKTKRGTLVTAETFSSTLSEAWFTSDVLIKSLEKYGGYADVLYEYINTHDVETASQAMEELGDAGDKLGMRAFKAAQEARTFSDAIGATQDAVSSGWMRSFKYIIGDTEEATELFTDMANGLWDVFAAGSEVRNEALAAWNEAGGRKELLKGIYDALDGIWSIVQVAKDSFSIMFPAMTADNISKISSRVADLGAQLKETFGIIEHQTSGRELVVDFALNTDSLFEGPLSKGAKGEAVKEMQEWLTEAGYGDLLGDAGADGIFGPKTEEALKKFQEDLYEGTEKQATGIFDEATRWALGEKTVGVKEAGEHWERVVSTWTEYPPALEKLQNIFDGLAAAGHLVERAFSTLVTIGKHFLQAFVPLGDVLLDVFESLTGGFKMLDENEATAEFFENVIKIADVAIGHLATGIQFFADAIRAIFFGPESLGEGNETLKAFANWIQTIKDKIKNTKIGKWLSNFGSNFSKLTKDIQDKGFINVFKERFLTLWTNISEYFSSGQAQADISSLFNSIGSFLTDIITAIWMKILGVDDSTAGGDEEAVAEAKKKIEKRVKKTLTDIGQFFKNIWNGIVTFFQKLFGGNEDSEEATEAGDEAFSFSNVFGSVLTAISNFFINLWHKLVAVANTLSDPKTWEDLGNKIVEIKNNVVDFFKRLFGGDKDEEKEDKKQQSNARSFLKTLLDWAPLWSLFAGIIGSVLLLLASLRPFIGIGLELAKAMRVKAEGGYHNKFLENAAGIALIAVGVGIIGFAVAKLGELELGQVLQGLITMIAVLGMSVAAMAIIDRQKINGANVMTFAGGFLMFAGALTIMAGVIGILGNMDPGVLVQGGVALVVLLGVLTTTAWLMRKLGSGVALPYKGLFQMSVAIAILAGVALILGLFPARLVYRGIVRMTAVLAVLGVFIVVLSHTLGSAQMDESISKNLIKIAGTVAILAGVALLLGMFDPAIVWRGIGAVAALTAIVAAFMVLNTIVSSKFKGGTDGMKSVTKVASAILILAIAVLLLGLLPENRLSKSLSVVLVLAFVVAGLSAMGIIMKRTNADVKPLMSIMGMLAGLIGVVALLALFPPDRLKAATEAIVALTLAIVAIGGIAILAQKLNVKPTDMLKAGAGLGGAFVLFTMILGAFLGFIGWIDELTGGGVVSKIESGARVLKAIFSALKPAIDLLGGSGVGGVGLMASVMALSGKFAGFTVLGGLAIGAGFDLLVGSIGAFLAGVGQLQDLSSGSGGSSLVDMIESGGDVMYAVSAALMSLVTGAMDELTKSVEKFGTAIRSLRDGVGGVSDEVQNGSLLADLVTAKIIVEELREFFKDRLKFEENSTDASYYARAHVLAQQLNTDVHNFGVAFQQLRAGLVGLTETDILEATNIAITVASTLDQFFKGLEDASGAVTMSGPVLAASPLSTPQQLSADMKAFGESFGVLRDNISGISTNNASLPSDVELALNVCRSVKTFFDEIGLVGGQMPTSADNDGLKLYSERLTSFNKDLVGLADSIKTYSMQMQGVTDRGIEAETTVALETLTLVKDKMVEIQSADLDPTVAGWGQKKTKFQTVLLGIGSLAQTILTTSHNLENANLTGEESTFSADIDSAITALTRVAEFTQFVAGMNIEKDPGWLSALFTGEKTSFQQVIDNIGKLNFNNLYSANGGLAGLSGTTIQTDIDTAILVLEKMAQLLNYVHTLLSGEDGQMKNINTDFITTAFNNLTIALSSFARMYEDEKAAMAAVQSVSDSINDIFSVGSAEAASNYGQTMLGMIESLPDILGSDYALGLVEDAIRPVNNAIIAKVRGTYSRFELAGEYLIIGIAAGIRNRKQSAVNAITEVASSVKRAWDIATRTNSPSKWGEERGGYLLWGITKGLADSEPRFAKDASRTINTMLGTMSAALAEGVDTTPTIRPVLDLTDIQNGVGRMDSLLSNKSLNLSTSAGLARSVTNYNDKIGPAASNGSGDILTELRALKDELGAMRETINDLELSMDGDKLVVGIGDKMDKFLGHRAAMERRRG